MRGWRGLGTFWVVVLAGLVAGGVGLHRQGPLPTAAVAPAPPEPDAAAPRPAEPTAAPPPEAPAATLEPAAEPTPLPASAPVIVPPAEPALPVPQAPAPPPLPVPATPAASPERPIPPPEPALLESTRHGQLPKVGEDGRTSIRAYARAFDRADQRPRIGLVIGNIGLNAGLSADAIRRLPGAAALAFSPYAPRPAPLLERARARGMETLTALPLEPTGWPLNDPGDRALLTGNAPAENTDRLEWALSRIQGQVGAIGALGPMRGERFAAIPELIGGLQASLQARGLLYIDPRPGAGTPSRAFGRGIDIVVDDLATGGEIERRLGELERIARERGSALGLASDPAPVLVERVASWAAGLEQRGIVLAPVSALIRRGDAVPRQ
ncbi:hypothetical protein C8P66_10948 [Humitalea rosea]|uniref:Divergent polysaccharide deacetylase n=1 Tax=Humitalea rosea TaxID=990373 RepID=A0A2W7ILG9_9PROT|nr:divergent polysaccharide deacetylase family protein [Humitalea rosea]PZW46551.1 hypothetical protein C8P66_10948 [Humitalea rosea]